MGVEHVGAEFLIRNSPDILEQSAFRWIQQKEQGKRDRVFARPLNIKGEADFLARFGLGNEGVNTESDAFSTNLSAWLAQVEDIHRFDPKKPGRFDRIRRQYHRQYCLDPNDVTQAYWNRRGVQACLEGKEEELRMRGVRITERRQVDTRGKEKSTWQYTYPEGEKQAILNNVIAAQQERLDHWLLFLSAPEQADCPRWIRFWALRSVVQLEEYHIKQKVFPVRRKESTATFPAVHEAAFAQVVRFLEQKYTREYIRLLDELDRADAQYQQVYIRARKQEILALAANAYAQELSKKTVLIETKDGYSIKVSSEQYKQLQAWQDQESTKESSLEDAEAALLLAQAALAQYYKKKGIASTQQLRPEEESFAQLYADAIEQFIRVSPELLAETAGAWKSFPQGSDAEQFVQELGHWDIGWCSLNAERAAMHLSLGAYRVYFSNDAQGNPGIPRIAIRTEQIAGVEQIREVRGIAAGQHLDNRMAGSSVLAEELARFKEKGISFDRTVVDTARCQELFKKHDSGQPLDREDLCFVYETERQIRSFGYGTDPRIVAIRAGRHPRQDLAYCLSCAPEAITWSVEELGQEEKKIFVGDVSLRGGRIAVERVLGNLEYWVQDEESTTLFPEVVVGDCTLYIKEGVPIDALPCVVDGNFSLGKIRRLVDLVFPQRVGGYLDLALVKTLSSVQLPHHIEGALYLSSLIEMENTVLPRYVGEDCFVGEGQRNGIIFPTFVGGTFHGSKLTSADRAVFPNYVGGNMDVRNIETALGAQFPRVIRGSWNIASLRSLEGVTLPKQVDGEIIAGALSVEERSMLLERYKN